MLWRNSIAVKTGVRLGIGISLGALGYYGGRQVKVWRDKTGHNYHSLIENRHKKIFEASKAMVSPETSQAVEDRLFNIQLVKDLLDDPKWRASRPHRQYIDEEDRHHNLTAGVLDGPGMFETPCIVFFNEEEKKLVNIAFLGSRLCGYKGVIHGGILATILDESMGHCCFPYLPHEIGMTANLSIDYKAPTIAGQFVALHANVTKVEGRKAWVESHVESVIEENDKASDDEKQAEPVVLAVGKALFVSPRNANSVNVILKRDISHSPYLD